MRYANLNLFYNLCEIDDFFGLESRGLKSLVLSNLLTNKNHFFDELMSHKLCIEEMINISLNQISTNDYFSLLSNYLNFEFYDNNIAIERTKRNNLLVYGNIFNEKKQYDFWSYYILSNKDKNNYVVFDSKRYYYSNYYSINRLESSNEVKIYDSINDENIKFIFKNSLILSSNIQKTILNYTGVHFE